MSDLVVIALSLQRLSGDEVCALNNAVQLFGRVQPGNLAFESCVKLKLIRDDGGLWDAESMKDACAYEIKRRFNSEEKIQWPKGA